MKFFAFVLALTWSAFALNDPMPYYQAPWGAAITGGVINPDSVNAASLVLRNQGPGYLIQSSLGAQVTDLNCSSGQLAAFSVGGSTTWYAIANNGTTLARGGASGSIQTTTDGSNLTQRSSGITSLIAAGTYGLSRYIMVGTTSADSTNGISVSSDAATWSPVKSINASRPYRSVACNTGMCLIGGTSSTLISTTNFSTFTAQTYGGTSGTIQVLVWSPTLSLWVGANGAGAIRTSPDGVTWTSRTSGVATALYAGVWDSVNSLFVVVGAGGVILTSPNGTTWTARTSGTTRDLFAVYYGGGKVVAAGDSLRILTSTNSTSWTSASIPADDREFDAGSYVGTTHFLTGEGGISYSSPDAVTWARVGQVQPACLTASYLTADSGVAKLAANNTFTGSNVMRTLNSITYIPRCDSTLANADTINAYINALPDSGGTVFLTGGTCLLNKPVRISKRNYVTLYAGNTRFVASPSGYPRFYLGTGQPYSRPMIMADSSVGVNIIGGFVDGSAFTDTLFQTDAVGIMTVACQQCRVERAHVRKFFPTNVTDKWGGLNDGGIAVRWSGIRLHSSPYSEANSNRVDSVRYDCIGGRTSGYYNSYFNNQSFDCFEGLQSAYYNTSPAGHMVRFLGNTVGRYRAAGIVSHSEATIIQANLVGPADTNGATTTQKYETSGIALFDVTLGSVLGNDLDSANAWTVDNAARGAIHINNSSNVAVTDNIIKNRDVGYGVSIEGVGTNDSNITVSGGMIVGGVGCVRQITGTTITGLTIRDFVCKNFTTLGVVLRSTSEQATVRGVTFSTKSALTSTLSAINLNQGSGSPTNPTYVYGNRFEVPTGSNKIIGIGTNAVIYGNINFDTTAQSVGDAATSQSRFADKVSMVTTLTAPRILTLIAPTASMPNCTVYADVAGTVNGLNTWTIHPVGGATINGGTADIVWATTYNSVTLCKNAALNGYIITAQKP